MPTAVIPREDTTALVIRDIMEMERIVNQVSWRRLQEIEDTWEVSRRGRAEDKSDVESDAPSKLLFWS